MIDYNFTKQADRLFSKLPIEIQHRIIEKLKFYLAQPNPFIFAKFIRRENNIMVFRFRVGDFRIIFDWDRESVLVTQILPKKFKRIYR